MSHVQKLCPCCNGPGFEAYSETLDSAMNRIQVGLLIGYRGLKQDAYTHEVFHVAVVVEETIILHKFEDVLFA